MEFLENFATWWFVLAFALFDLPTDFFAADSDLFFLRGDGDEVLFGGLSELLNLNDNGGRLLKSPFFHSALAAALALVFACNLSDGP